MDDIFNRPKTHVQWMLDNRCNYNCSYCHDIFRKGDRARITDDLLLEVCKDITYHYDDLGKDVVFEFLGGEPTLQEKIPELGNRLSNFPTSLILKTNGSASLEWWKKTRSVLGGVVISVHREFADVGHIERVIEFLRDEDYGYPINLEVLFPVTHRPESFNWGVSQLKRFRNKYELGNLQPLFSDFGRGSSMYMPYTERQWEVLRNCIPPLKRTEKSTPLNRHQPNSSTPSLTKPEEPALLNKDQPNSSTPSLTKPEEPTLLNRYLPIFTGQRCYAGIETLTIDSSGHVWRGWCREGGIIGNIHEMPVNWPKDPIICQKNFCHNGFDQKAKKEII